MNPPIAPAGSAALRVGSGSDVVITATTMSCVAATGGPAGVVELDCAIGDHAPSGVELQGIHLTLDFDVSYATDPSGTVRRTRANLTLVEAGVCVAGTCSGTNGDGYDGTLVLTLAEPGMPRSATIDGALSEVHAVNDRGDDIAMTFSSVAVLLP